MYQASTLRRPIFGDRLNTLLWLALRAIVAFALAAAPFGSISGQERSAATQSAPVRAEPATNSPRSLSLGALRVGIVDEFKPHTGAQLLALKGFRAKSDTTEPSDKSIGLRALSGSVIGAAAGGTIGYVYGKYDERNCQQECGISPTIGLAYGILFGAFIGLVAGLASAQ